MRRWVPCLALLAACAPAQPAGTVFYASGADLQSINPLVTTHPLAKQVQRYALFTTLVRLDSALRVEPYLAESWTWSADRQTLTLLLHHDLHWHDGMPTTSRDARFTLEAARDPAAAYPRGRPRVPGIGRGARHPHPQTASAIRVSGNGVVDAGAGDDLIDASSSNPSPYPLQSGIGSGARLGAFLYGNQGSDSIVGSEADDVIAGGEGDDFLDGSRGADRYLCFAGERGEDLLLDRGGATQDQYYDWFYARRGIADWRTQLALGGQWLVEEVGAYSSLDQVPLQYRTAARYIEPLPLLPPAVSANDYGALAPLLAAGFIEQDTIVLPHGVAPSDLGLSWGEVLTGSDAGGSNQAYRTPEIISGNVINI